MAKAGKNRMGTTVPTAMVGTAELSGRSMPESLAAEAAVLGSMIIDPECIGQVVEMLRAEAFYRLEHQRIFDALVALYEKNKGTAIDGLLIRDELLKRGQMIFLSCQLLHHSEAVLQYAASQAECTIHPESVLRRGG